MLYQWKWAEARKRRREDSVNGFVLADFTWDFRALLSHSCLFLFPFSPRVTSSPVHTAFSGSAPSLRVVVTSGKKPPSKQMFSATSSLFNGLLQSSSASLKWSSCWKVWDFMFCSVPCSHLAISSRRESGEQDSLSSICPSQESHQRHNFTTMSPRLFSWLTSFHTSTLLPSIPSF